MHETHSRTWIVAIVFAFSATFIAQSLADEAIPPIASEPITTNSPTPTPEPTTTLEVPINPEPMQTQSPVISDSVSVSASPTPTKSQPHAIEDQSIFLRTAGSVLADPRANSVLITPISLSSANMILACISVSGAKLDISSKNTSENLNPDLASGDLSSFVRISGSSEQVMNLINSHNGLRVISTSGNIVHKSVSFKFIAVSEQTLDASLCNSGKASNNRMISILPLGIDLEMKKADVRLVK